MAALVYYVATSVDGFIARPDGSFGDFPWDPEFGAHLLDTYPETFPAHLRSGPVSAEGNRRFGAVLMGRHTYEVGVDAGVVSPYPTLRQFVFSTRLRESPSPDVALVREDAAEVVTRLKREEARDVWLCGGAVLAASLFEAGLVDEVVVKLNPVLFGAGIPLLARPVPTVALDLRDLRRFPSGHAWLHYDVRR
ncbi:dihydrofolate reductase family protein [Roseisolibacter sp. H3M3-2]|uniref:dihydrofolate reductase family protein n=1 Tax=Roseisolibacter sp. H3M3-2 TaxID=3031323 RepID=UPI0023DA4CAA|nr:dihydrofolate reductase family protein [Roseisolibacter sp. H3M3-2]MDF1503907.1 dihydrofolate reductase family protein [Roseisolibacter sp. H3M3-2]